MNKEFEDRLRAHLWKEFNGYNSLRYSKVCLRKTTGYSIHICCLSSKAHEIIAYIENVFGLHGCRAIPYVATLGTDWRTYTRLFWDYLTREELDCIDTLLRIKG